MSTPNPNLATHENALAAWRAGQPDLARTYCRELLSAWPHDQRALNLLAVVYGSCGMPQQALEPLQTLAELRPTDPTVRNNLASALLGVGRLSEAITAYRLALQFKPDYAGARYNLANALVSAGSLDEAITEYRAVVKLSPEMMDAHLQLGNALRQRGDIAAAIASLREAATLQPDLPVVLDSLGTTLRLAGLNGEALAVLRHAVRRDPNYAPALRSLGAALAAGGELSEAISHFRRALARDPREPSALSGLSAALTLDGQPEEALAVRLRALQAERKVGGPAADRIARSGAVGYDDFIMRAAVLEMHRALWDQAGVTADIESLRRQAKGQERDAAVPPHMLMALDGDPARQLACSQAIAGVLARRIDPAGVKVPRVRSARPPCRVAFVSPDLRHHVVGISMVELLENLDRTRVEPIGIYIGPQESSETHLRCEKACSEFHRVLPRTDAEIAAFMREREIDIAVDLAGYTSWSRPEIFGYRAAPVQVQYLGFAGSMGTPWIDYIVADAFVIPERTRSFYSEKVVCLPESFFPIDSGAPPPPPVDRAAEGLPEDAVVLAAFNDAVRIVPRMLELWATILQRAPRAVLWLRGSNPTAEANMRACLGAHGADMARVHFTKHVDPRERHLSRHALADLMLDTLPYNMHSTCRDSLWLGLPVLTCPGEAFSSRVAGSLVSAVGMPELIATDPDDYLEKAVALASDAALLRALRRKLQERVHGSPLFDMQRLARHFEAACELMHTRAQAGLPPEHIMVPPLTPGG